MNYKKPSKRILVKVPKGVHLHPSIKNNKQVQLRLRMIEQYLIQIQLLKEKK